MLLSLPFLGLLATVFAAPVEERALGYKDTIVYHHNLHRANHSAPDIMWDVTLAETAKSIARTCVFAHNMTPNGGGYGQNIAAGIQSSNISYVISDMFYNSEAPAFQSLYGKAQPSYDDFAHWGHFSQIVWKSTSKVGCATWPCPDGLANVPANVPRVFTVCNYKSPGNYGGQYADNIGRPIGKPTAHWDALL